MLHMQGNVQYFQILASRFLCVLGGLYLACSCIISESGCATTRPLAHKQKSNLGTLGHPMRYHLTGLPDRRINTVARRNCGSF